MYIYYLLRVRVSLSVCVVLWLCCCGSVRHQWCVVSQLFWLAGIGAVCMRSRVYTEQCGSGAVGSSDPHRRGCSESRSLWKCFQEEERQKGFTSKWSLLHWTVFAEGLDVYFKSVMLRKHVQLWDIPGRFCGLKRKLFLGYLSGWSAEPFRSFSMCF